MKRRRLLLILPLLLLVSGLLLVPSVRWPIYGRLRGEAFYKGMPTSYWHDRCPEYFVHYNWENGIVIREDFSIGPSWLEQVLDFCGIYEDEPVNLFSGEADAIPVLIQLLRTGDRQAQLVAGYGLLMINGNSLYEPDKEATQAALREAIPALQDAARSNDRDVRANALWTLRQIDPEIADRTEEALGKPR